MEATIITAIVGAIATIAAALITARTKDIAIAQLRKEWALYKDAASGRESYLDIDYGIRITQPRGEVVSGDTVEVRGSYNIMPPPDTLRLYSVHSERTPFGERFWPQEIVKEFFPDKTWRARANIRGLPKTGGAIVAAIVSQPAIVLWDYYYKVGHRIGWWDVEGWPNNSVVCDRVTVTRA
jgi:hypothetical protein